VAQLGKRRLGPSSVLAQLAELAELAQLGQLAELLTRHASTKRSSAPRADG